MQCLLVNVYLQMPKQKWKNHYTYFFNSPHCSILSAKTPSYTISSIQQLRSSRFLPSVIFNWTSLSVSKALQFNKCFFGTDVWCPVQTCFLHTEWHLEFNSRSSISQWSLWLPCLYKTSIWFEGPWKDMLWNHCWWLNGFSRSPNKWTLYAVFQCDWHASWKVVWWIGIVYTSWVKVQVRFCFF